MPRSRLIKEEDLPSDYTTRLTYMKANDNSWHFNPGEKDYSAIDKGTIIINSSSLVELKKFMKDAPIEIGTSIYTGELSCYKENDLVWRKLDHVYHGYNEHNTKMAYLRISYDDSPLYLKEIMDQTDYINKSIGIIRLTPGNIIPWHYDTYIFFRSALSSEKQATISRTIIFPFEWHWGHFYQIGNNVLSNWQEGQSYSWPEKRYHLAVNAGTDDFYMLAITGDE